MTPTGTDTGKLVWDFSTAPWITTVNSNKGADITIKFTTKVSTTIGDGVVLNVPGEDVTKGYGSSFNNVPSKGENTPGTAWGQLSILKTDSSTTSKKLQGAEFEVVEKPEASVCPLLDDLYNETDNKRDYPEVATGTSNAQGIVEWDGKTPNNPLGLWIANWDSDSEKPEELAKDYCVYETKAPAGYTAQQAAIEVTITPGVAGAVTETVQNTQKGGPDLPLTGAAGTILLIIGGLGVIALAAGAHVVIRNRQAKKA